MSGYIDPWAQENADATWAMACRWAADAAEAYMEWCDLQEWGLDEGAPEWVIPGTRKEWRRDGMTWPEWVHSQHEWASPSILHGWKLRRARERWGRAFRVMEALPNPHGVYESNCIGWPGHRGKCCKIGRCETWPYDGLRLPRKPGEPMSSAEASLEKLLAVAIDARGDHG